MGRVRSFCGRFAPAEKCTSGMLPASHLCILYSDIPRDLKILNIPSSLFVGILFFCKSPSADFAGAWCLQNQRTLHEWRGAPASLKMGCGLENLVGIGIFTLGDGKSEVREYKIDNPGFK
jgi:hypothetical protein